MTYGRHPDCQTFDDAPGMHTQMRRSFDVLDRAYPTAVIRDGKARLTYQGRQRLQSMRAKRADAALCGKQAQADYAAALMSIPLPKAPASNLHPLFDALLRPFAPVDRAA